MLKYEQACQAAGCPRRAARMTMCMCPKARSLPYWARSLCPALADDVESDSQARTDTLPILGFEELLQMLIDGRKTLQGERSCSTCGCRAGARRRPSLQIIRQCWRGRETSSNGRKRRTAGDDRNRPSHIFFEMFAFPSLAVTSQILQRLRRWHTALQTL